MSNPWWQLPGPAAFVEEGVQDLLRGSSLILALPRHVSEGLESAVRHAFEIRGGLAWESLSPADEMPLPYLFRRFVADLPPHDLRTLPTLCGQEGFLGRALWLRDITAKTWPRWRDFLVEYAHASRSISVMERSLFVAVPTGEQALDLPKSDVCLSLSRWSGMVDPLDLLVYTSRLMRRRKWPAVQKQLACAIISTVAVWDPAVCDRLGEESIQTIANPTAVLCQLAKDRDWSGIPASQPEVAWALGQRDIISGENQWHSAALNGDAGAREVKRRIWSAEVGVLLPFVEQKRLEHLSRLELILKPPFELSPGVVVETLQDLEIGQLEWLLVQRRRGVPEEVRQLKLIRNSLAHLEPLPPDMIDSALLR